jgi:hypothetical protein
MRAIRLLATILTAASVVCAGSSLPASADGTPVTAPATPVPCDTADLIAAIKDANAAGGGSLDLAAGCTYTLDSPQPGTTDGLPPINSPITINGNGATITRSTAPSTPAFRIFEVPSAPGALTIRALTVSNGRTTGPDNGAGISVHDGGALSAEGSRLSHNNADFQGGAIFNDKGTVRLTNDTISNNVAFNGGGIYNNEGELTASRTAISDNTISDPAGGGGGGVFNFLGTLTMTEGLVARNTGDAIVNFEQMTIGNSVIRENTGRAGAGINNVGNLMVSRSLLRENRTTELGGGGLINFQIAGILGTATLEDTAISDNVAATSGGGVFVDGGTVTLTRSAVTGNRAANTPGGISNAEGEVVLNAAAVAGNVPTNCAGSPTPVPGCVG